MDLVREASEIVGQFHLPSLRSILKICWEDNITNVVLKAQLQCTGHHIRIEGSRMLKQLLYSDLCLGEQNQCRPHKLFNGCIKANIGLTDTNQLEFCAQNMIS